MRYGYRPIGLVLLLAAAAPLGCAPGVTDAGSGVIDAIAGITDSVTGSGDVAVASDAGDFVDPDASASGPSPTAQSVVNQVAINGSVADDGDYQLFDLGTALFGDEWTIAPIDAPSSNSFLVVLLDDRYELLQRQLVSSGSPLDHIVRADTPTLYAGVTPAIGKLGGSFKFEATRAASVTVPAPRQQVVWVNFGAGSDVRVHRREGMSFPPFDAATLDPEYAGATPEVKAAILAAMREDYDGYNIVLLTSDDGAPPAGSCACVHIGGSDSRLLGLADNVDQYNADLGQTAVVYVEGFADFSVMNLTAEEMGQMIGNVASHELGHLLGLFHTAVPADLMDTTGDAWDLADNQSFLRGELEATVFPFGYENSPARLAETLGFTTENAKLSPVTKAESRERMIRKAELRSLVRTELHCRCGNCLNPDE